MHSVPNSASSLNVLPIGTGFTGRFAGCALIGQKRYCHFYDCNGKAIQPDYTFLSTRKVHIGGKDIELGFFECPEKKRHLILHRAPWCAPVSAAPPGRTHNWRVF